MTQDGGFNMADPRWRRSENTVITKLYDVIYHLIHFEFTDFRVRYWPFDFYCRSLNPVEATEWGRKCSLCNVPLLGSFGTFSMFIYSLILSDWRRERFCYIYSSGSNHKMTGIEVSRKVTHPILLPRKLSIAFASKKPWPTCCRGLSLPQTSR